MTQAGDETAAVAALDALFAPWNRIDQPGLAVGVRYRGRIIYRRAFGMASLESGTANSPRTLLRIGSTTKHFLAVLVLHLQRDGLLDLDTPIGRYLTELAPPNSEPTLRQLLQHRGGTRCHIDLNLLGHGEFAAPVGSALETLRVQQGRNFAPGTATMYNNGGYHLVSLAASRVTGQPFADLLKQRLFDPLGLNATSLVESDYVVTPGIASFHRPNPGGGWLRGLFCSNEILGEGGIVSTVDDMLAWTSYLHSNALSGERTLLDQLADAPPEIDGSAGYYGLGMMQRGYRGLRTFSHPGGVVGGSSDLLMIPDHQLDIIIISNGAPNAVPYSLTERVIDALLPELAPPAFPDPSDYRQWLGLYGSSETGMVYSLEDLGGGLYLRIAQYSSPYRLERGEGEWLVTGITGLSSVHVLCERLRDGAPAILVRTAGTEDLLSKLVVAPEAPVPDEIGGRYESAESGLSAVISIAGAQPSLTIRDRWGVTHYQLEAAGDRWLTMRSPHGAYQFWATIWFPDGWTGDFRINSARTRDLRFQRATSPA